MASSKTALERFAEETRKDESAVSDTDSYEDMAGTGRNSRHQVFAVQLINERGEMAVVPYSAILWGSGRFNGEEFRFEFARGEELWEATIRGSAHLQRVVDKLTAGKRESIRCAGSVVESIAWRAVPQSGG